MVPCYPDSTDITSSLMTSAKQWGEFNSGAKPRSPPVQLSLGMTTLERKRSTDVWLDVTQSLNQLLSLSLMYCLRYATPPHSE